jgi:hypothetical protein
MSALVTSFVEYELRSFTKAVETLMNEPVTHASMRVFYRRLHDISVEALAEQLPHYLARYHYREEDIRGELRSSIEDTRDFLEDLVSHGPGRHMTHLIRQASARLRVFEKALASIVNDEGEDAEDDDDDDDENEDDQPIGHNCHCEVCGRTLTAPKSVECKLGPRCRTIVKYWNGIWAEVRVVAPDLAARVETGEIEVSEAVSEFEVRDQATLGAIGDQVWERIRQPLRKGAVNSPIETLSVNGSD